MPEQLTLILSEVLDLDPNKKDIIFTNFFNENESLLIRLQQMLATTITDPQSYEALVLGFVTQLCPALPAGKVLKLEAKLSYKLVDATEALAGPMVSRNPFGIPTPLTPPPLPEPEPEP